jgi:transcriptional regulator with XRE-family HTH domain
MKRSEYMLRQFKNFGENVEKFRIGKGLGVAELSELTGIRKEYIKKIEKGESYGIRNSAIKKIADALEIHLKELFRE